MRWRPAIRTRDVRVTIIRGAGTVLSPPATTCSPTSPRVSRSIPRAASPTGRGTWWKGFFKIWDLAKPVIAQVHGYCLAGGTELATACDLVYVAEDAKIGYPVVRSISPPDNQFYPWIVGLRRSMEMMLTGDHISGTEGSGVRLRQSRICRG